MNTRILRAAAAGIAFTAMTLAACSPGSPSPPPSRPPAPTASVNTPPPDQRGPEVTVEGTVAWRTDHVGCAEMVTTAGQQLRITGQMATDRERAVFGGAAPSERVRITGYAFVPLNSATPCGGGLPFVAEKVEPVHQ
ncbi:hypothetical protein SAMN04489732_1514 [Amycolatopsis saalfeldensis]|uniref:Lipoprotein n=1 Tax=Amycolatopsis saalfeldensis TaxID=394193 RepID=A0A1H8YR25_9PSEU|nr:hypothetical protein SAMN04489732_1514 [Amycolatopsis saalfeldensis]